MEKLYRCVYDNLSSSSVHSSVKNCFDYGLRKFTRKLFTKNMYHFSVS